MNRCCFFEDSYLRYGGAAREGRGGMRVGNGRGGGEGEGEGRGKGGKGEQEGGMGGGGTKRKREVGKWGLLYQAVLLLLVPCLGQNKLQL